MSKEPTTAQNAFSTSDTALAAWLISQGYELLELDNSKPNSVAFLFVDDSEALTAAIKMFQTAQGEAGIVIAFYRAYKRLLVRIKEKNSQ